MIIQNSNFIILFLINRYHLKLILFTIFLSSSFYFYDIFAIDEMDEKNLSLNSSFKIENSINNTLTSDFNFSNVTNITNNIEDSVYAQIAAVNNTVYLVWQESVNDKSNKNNYDVYFKKSENNGNTFSKPINLSNNTGFSEHPQIAVTKNGIYIVWADNTNSNNTEIMFTKSEDNGTTFSKVINLSKNSKNSNNVEISAFDENVYVVWQDIDDQNNNNNKNSSIMFKSSIDSGNTFNDTIELANNMNEAYPKVNSYQDYVYIVWNSENNDFSKDNENSGLFFIKSYDKGNSFTNPHIIQVTKSENKNSSEKINHPTNVEIANHDSSYIVWQDIISKENQDIFIANIKNVFQSTKLVNLSNNTGISECPQIAVANNHIYVVWEDITPGNHEILFTKGTVQQNK